MRIPVLRLRPLIMGIALGLSACDSPVGLAGGPPDVREWTVGNAAAALGPNGRFQLPAPNRDPDRLEIISPDRALELARAWKAERFQGQSTGGLIENLHGAPIDWDRIAVSEFRPILFQEPIYQPLSEEYPFFLQVALGPEYVVPLYQSGTQAAMLSMVAHASHLRLDENGFISRAEYLGVEASMAIIPNRAEAEMPPSPEHAVEWVVSTVGVPVSEVPRLIQPRNPWSPALGAWEIVLAEPIAVTVLGSGERVTVDTVFVSSSIEHPVSRSGRFVRIQYSIADPVQPESDTITVDVEGIAESEFVIGILPGMPVEFLEVRLD